MRALQLRLKSERGMALIMALGMMVVLAAVSVTLIDYATSNQHSSNLSNTRQTSFQLAEAGINNTLAFLNQPTNNALDPNIFCSSGSTVTYDAQNNATVPAGCKKTNTYDSGTVTWYGALNKQSSYWVVTSTGTLRNPTGANAQVTKTLTARIVVTPTNTQPLNNPAWNYVFATHTGSTCDETLSNNVSGGARMYVLGNLCLQPNVGLAPSSLVVKGNLTVNNNATVGDNTSMSTRSEVYVGGSCWSQKSGLAAANPCSGNQDARYIYSKTNPPSYVVGVNSSPTLIAAPTTDFPGWYQNAMPGPKQGCATSSGTPPQFDSDTTMNGTNPVQDLTPATSYQCRVGPAPTTTTTTLAGAITASQTTITVASSSGFPNVNNFSVDVGGERMFVAAGAGTTTWTVQRGASGTTAAAASSGTQVSYTSTPAGEITWNATSTASSTYGPAKTLTIAGTIFFDGPVKVDNGALNQYNGQASIYVNGTFYLSGKICGGVSGSNCSFATWNPNTEMMTIVASGNGSATPSVPAGDSIYLTNNGSFQGALYGSNNVEFSNNSYSDGPIVGSEVKFANNVSTQSFAPVVTVPAGMPGNPEVYAQPNPPQLFSG